MTSGSYGLGRREPNLQSQHEEQVAPGRLTFAWQADLFQSQCCWYDLLMDSPVAAGDSLDMLEEQLRQMLDLARSRSDLCFIIFWAARPKLRFNLDKQPRYALMSNELVFYVDIVGQQEKMKLSTAFIDIQSRQSVKPHVEVNERFITIYLPDQAPETVSVYDFLDNCGLDLNISSEIYALSSTTDPVRHWLGCADRELSEMLYKVPNEDHDFFFFCNLFQLTQKDENSNAPIAATQEDEAKPWLATNIPTNSGAAFAGKRLSISSQDKAFLLETALRHYFQTPQGFSNRYPEELQTLESAVPSHHYMLDITMDLGKPIPLYRFSSLAVEAADKHKFSCEINGQEIQLKS